ncbi:MAG TPA: DUF1127 domain-containing protein [Burkholderiaceae bacterium]|nr:DUF1127 domain-containing protein [Burkholderiaceae bacterium]
MTRTHPPAWLGSTFLRMTWRGVADVVERFRRDQQERRELELLDSNALRDLGLHRSEYGSYVAEAIGAADPTRRRIGAWAD